VAFALLALRADAAWLRRSGVSNQLEAVVWAGVNAMAGAFRLVGVALAGRTAHSAPLAGSGEPGKADRHPARAVLRGLLLAIPFLLAFGALFMSADRIFAGLVTGLVDFDQEIVSHVFVTVVLTWLACGYLTGFLTGTRLDSLSNAFGTRPAVGTRCHAVCSRAAYSSGGGRTRCKNPTGGAGAGRPRGPGRW
jgi:hypothetical protein